MQEEEPLPVDRSGDPPLPPGSTTQTTSEGLLLGQIAVERKIIDLTQLKACLDDQEAAHKNGEELPLGTLLVRKGFVNSDDLKVLLDEQARRAEGLPDIPRYAIKGRLGQGATALVYRAWDRELNRAVALKILRETAGMSEVARHRFRREAQAAAGLAHPHVLTVYDSGEQDGRLYLVMELVEGHPFSQVLRDSRDDFRRMLSILEKAAQGVAAAHARGIVHRDLKPANILVTSAGEPKVGDFGLAHLVDSSTELTRTGAVLGTPLYMSPEQVEGRSKDISARTDVYALGAMLYETLTGRPPHVGDSAHEIYAKISKEDPVLPHVINPHVPRDIETIALKALDKSPRGRYANALSFSEDLRRYLAGGPVLARPTSALSRLIRRIGRKRAIVLPLALVCAMALASAGWVFLSTLETHREREAEKLLEIARPALDQAFRYVYSRDADYEELHRRVEAARTTIEKAILKAPGRASGHYLLGHTWEISGWDDRAEAGYRTALKLDPEYGPVHFRLGQLLLKRSYRASLGVSSEAREAARLKVRGMVKEASRELEASMAEGTGFDDRIQRELARAMLAYSEGDDDSVTRIADAALSRLSNVPGAEDFHWLKGLVAGSSDPLPAFDRALQVRPKYPLVLLCRAAARLERGDVDGAISDCDAAIAVQPRYSEAHYNRGVARLERGDNDGAVSDFTEALRLAPEAPHVRINLGIAYSRVGDFRRAREEFEACLENNPADWIALFNRGEVRLLQGNLQGALSDFDSAINHNPSFAKAFNGRGLALSRNGEFKEALAAFSRAIDLDPALAQAYNNRGGIRERLDMLDEAVRDFGDALRIDPGLADASYNRGLVLARMEKYAEAVGDLSRAMKLKPKWPAPYAVRSQAYEIMGNAAAAYADAKKAIDLGVDAETQEKLNALMKRIDSEF